MTTIQCPYKVIDENHNFYPKNTCWKKWNYCTHCGDYKDCDLYKRSQTLLKTLLKFEEDVKRAYAESK